MVNGRFYGSAFVEVTTLLDAKQLVARAESAEGLEHASAMHQPCVRHALDLHCARVGPCVGHVLDT